MLHKKKITDYIKKLLKSDSRFDDMEIHRHFVYSLEIVENEIEDTLKYWFLNPSEYLEFIVRIALAFYKEKKETSMEYKICDFI
jgi:hypothetical protein